MVKYLLKGAHIKHKALRKKRTVRVTKKVAFRLTHCSIYQLVHFIGKRMRNAYILFPVIPLLASCAEMTKDPWLKDVLTHPERAELTDKDTQLRLSYLSRSLMESDDRAKLNSEIQNTQYVKSWNAGQTATAAQMTTDLVVGNFNSAQGATVGAALFSADLILGEVFDGSDDITSKAWLPDTFNGIKLEQQIQATQAMVTLIHQQANKVADSLGWSMSCLYGCEGVNQVLLFQNIENKSLNSEYLYQPSDFVINVQFNKLVKVADTDPVNAIIGEKLGWQTSGNHSFYIGIWSGLLYDGAGNPDIRKNEKTGFTYAAAKRDVSQTHLGRDILRIFHGTPYTLYGSKEVYPKVVFYNKVAYSFISNSNKKMVKYYLDEKSLLESDL